MNINIGIWGDSLVYGNNDQECLGWATMLRKWLKDKAEEKDTGWVNTYNLGVCAETSKGLLKRFSVEIAGIQPNIVLFDIGINDSSSRLGVDRLIPLEEFQKNMKEMFSVAKDVTKKVLCVGLTRVNESLVNPYPFSSTKKSWNNAQIEIYDQALEALCNTKEVTYIRMSNVVPKKDLDDGLHPNTEGHKKMFEVIKKEIKLIL